MTEQQTKIVISESDVKKASLRQISSLVAQFQQEAQNEKENRVQAQMQAQEKGRLVSEAWRIISELKNDKQHLEMQVERMRSQNDKLVKAAMDGGETGSKFAPCTSGEAENGSLSVGSQSVANIGIKAALTDILRKGQVLGGGKHSDTTARNGKVKEKQLEKKHGHKTLQSGIVAERTRQLARRLKLDLEAKQKQEDRKKETLNIASTVPGGGAIQSRDKRSEESKVSYQLAQLISKVWSGNYLACDPSSFYKVFQASHPQFKVTKQHDCQEFLGLLLDSVHQEMIMRSTNSYDKSDDTKSPTLRDADQWWRLYCERQKSIVVDTFQGQFRSRVTCQDCGHVSVTYQPFTFLSLPLPEKEPQAFYPVLVQNPLNGLDRGHCITRFRVRLTLPYRAAQLIEAVNYLLRSENKLPIDGLVTGIMKNTGLVKLLSDDDTLGHIGRTETLYIFEPVRMCSKNTSSPTPAILRDKDKRRTSLPLTSTPTSPVRGRGRGRFSLPDAHTRGCGETSGGCTANENESHQSQVTSLQCTAVREDVPLRVRQTEKLSSSSQRILEIPVLFVTRNKQLGTEGRRFGHPLVAHVFEDTKGKDIELLVKHILQKTTKLGALTFNMNLFNAQGMRCSRYPCISWCTCCQVTCDDVISFKPGDHLIVSQKNLLPEVDKQMNNCTEHESITKREKASIGLTDCVENLVNRELLETARICPNCNKCQSASKTLSLCHLPDALIIHLKRYNKHNIKVNTPVDCPVDLNLRRYIATNTKYSAGEGLYDLVASVSHHGDINGGHYTACTRNSTSSPWRKFDDGIVTEMQDGPQDCADSAYLLFYRQRTSSSLNLSRTADNIEIKDGKTESEILLSDKMQRLLESKIMEKYFQETKNRGKVDNGTVKSKGLLNGKEDQQGRSFTYVQGSDVTEVKRRSRRKSNQGRSIEKIERTPSRMRSYRRGVEAEPKQEMSSHKKKRRLKLRQQRRAEKYDIREAQRFATNEPTQQDIQRCECNHCQHLKILEKQLKEVRRFSGAAVRKEKEVLNERKKRKGGHKINSEVKGLQSQPELTVQTSSEHDCLTTESDNSVQPCQKSAGEEMRGSQSSLCIEDRAVYKAPSHQQHSINTDPTPESKNYKAPSHQEHGTNTDPTPESTDSEVQVTIMSHNMRIDQTSNSDEETSTNNTELQTRRLLCAVEGKDLRGAVQLLKEGADPSLTVDGVSPLHVAAGMSSSLCFHFTRLFLEHGADPNVRSVDGLTPVHVAAMWGRIECLKLLLNSGGNPYEADDQGLTAVDLAKTFEQDTSADTSEYLSKMDDHYSSLIRGSFSSLSSDQSHSELRYVPYLYEENKNKNITCDVDDCFTPPLSSISGDSVPGCGTTWSRSLKKKLSVHSAARKLRKSSSRLLRRLSSFTSFLSGSSS